MVTNSVSESSNNQALVYGNSIEVLNKLFNSLTSKELSATITLKNASGEDVVMTLPNLFFLDSEIKRLDNNVNTLSGVNNVVYLQNSDGTYNKVFSDKLTSTPKPIDNLRLPVEFNRKNNWFFENYLTPLLYIDFDLSELIDDNVNKLSVTRVILDTDNDISTNYFNSQLKGRVDLDYDTLLLDLGLQGISVNIDTDTYNLNPSILRYNGTFGVTSTFESFNDSLGRMVRYYQFANINYTDNLSETKNTQTLKVGDVLSVSKATKYKVETIDVSSRVLSLTLVSGNEPIPTGDNVLTLDSQTYSNKKISVNVGYDEKQVIFVTPITDLNVTTPFLSNGVCFNSNELRLVNSNNEVITLEEYYRREVVDFGQQIMNLAKEKSVPTVFGEIPNAPNITLSNFKVEQINTHIGNENITEQIKRLLSDKTQTKNDINAKDVAIANLVNQVQRTIPGSERTTSENTLTELTGVRNSLVSKYNSIITSLSLIYKENSVENIRPKYRIRGFWGYPNKVFNERTGFQEIVNFKVYYRYLTVNGTLPNQTQTNYTTTDGVEKTGVFSNWNVYVTEPRIRKFDSDTNRYVWVEDDTKDPDVINSNQLDIPISVGESVEIKIQSVSEAGYPSNPLISDFSNSVILSFPEELNEQIDLYSLLEESAREQERALIYQQISNYDFARHFLNNRFVDNVYYGHDTTEVSHYDGDGYVRVSEVITNLQKQITDLTNKLNSIDVGGTTTTVDFRTGKLKVYIKGVNRNGDTTIYPVWNGGTVEIQPPSYFNRVSKLPLNDIRGAIIKESYTLVIENEGSGNLKLSTIYPGLLTDNLPYKLSTDGSLFFKDKTIFDENYLNYKRYDLVPMVYNGFNSPNSVTQYNNRFGWGKQQSPQTTGQFIYSRYTSVDGFKKLYYDEVGGSQINTSNIRFLSPINLPNPDNSVGDKNTLIWNGKYSSDGKILGDGLLNEFCVNVAHPDVILKRRYEQLVTINKDIETKLQHAVGFNLEKDSNANAGKQSLLTPINDAKLKYVKFGYLDSDRYLVGSNTTGLYFYPSPKTPDDIRVGNDFNSTKELRPNEKIEIPLNVEYRMTDYYNNTSNAKTSLSMGVVGGYNKINLKRKDFNISYEKTLGFDIFINDGGNVRPFSFDVKVNTIYGSDKNVITLQNVFTDTTNDVNTLNLKDTVILTDSVKFLQI